MRGTRITPHRPGFSLVELLMVVAVISIMAGVAVPRISQASAQRRANLAAAKFEADLDRVIRGARAQGARRVLAQQANPTMYVFQDATGTVHFIDMSVEPYGVDKITFTLDEGGSTVAATPDGMLESGGTVRFAIGSAYKDVKLAGVRTPSVDDAVVTLGVDLSSPRVFADQAHANPGSDIVLGTAAADSGRP